MWIRFFHIYLFIRLLYHNVSVSCYMALDDRMIFELQLEVIWKEAVTVYYTASLLKGMLKSQKPQDSWW